MIDRSVLEKIVKALNLNPAMISGPLLLLTQVVEDYGKQQCAAGEWLPYPENKPESISFSNSPFYQVECLTDDGIIVYRTCCYCPLEDQFFVQGGGHYLLDEDEDNLMEIIRFSKIRG